MDGDVLRQGAVLLAVTGGILSGATGDYGDAAGSASPVVPADYAFGIWVPIYAGVVAYAVDQARATRRTDALLQRTGWPVAAAVGLSGVWVRGQDPPWLQLPVIAATTTAAVIALGRAQPRSAAEDSVRARWVVQVPVGLLAGWLTLATTAATTEVLIASGARVRRRGVDAAGALVLAGTAAAALSGARLPRAGGCAAALAWGLVGVAVRGARRWPLTGVVAGVGAGVAASVGLRPGKAAR
ncbi:hypothetical protein AB2L27_04550 [Kineococcus sp. LSe6-4]|uniref:Tryptophan-rich sensory protein n=1 Tax=Kineococcus halophytocola TaxID=3234027 RepID=A0ABV4GXL7_9ACTN